MKTKKVSCQLCKSRRVSLVKRGVWGKGLKMRVWQCARCGVAFLQPFMTESEEAQYYLDYNIHAKKRGVILEQSTSQLHEQSKHAAIDRHRVIGKYFTKSKSVLEIGSSTGAFLALLPSTKLYGVEPSTENRVFSTRYCDKTYPKLEDVPLSETFDIICMFHTLEHIRNPIAFLQDCKKHLKKAGRVIIEVPCITDPLLTLIPTEEFRDFYFQPMHPFVHSEKSLRTIIQSCGLATEKVIYYQRYGLDNHLHWLLNRKPGKSKTISDFFADFSPYKKYLEAHSTTDTIIIIAKMREQ